jgi:hypothetical protein
LGTYQGTSKIRAKMKEKKIKSQKLIMYVVLELPDKLPLMFKEKKSEKNEKYEKSENEK